MFVKYFIPEDGDEQAHPNVFRLEATQPTLTEIKNAFPVPGSYHFRFLKNIGSHIVWLDVIDDGSALPVFQGSLFMKVSRIANSSSSIPSVVQGVVSPAASNAFSQPEPSPRVNEAASVPPPVKAPKPSVEKQKSEKLLKFDDDITMSPSSNSSDFTASAPAASSGASLLPENDLLGISSSSVDTTSHKPVTSNSDFFGMETLQPMSAPVCGVMGGSQRSLSPMNPMTAGLSGNSGIGPMGAMNGGGRGPMGAMGASQGVMSGGRGPQGGMQQGRGMPPPQRQMGGPGTPGYDPFNNIAGLNGLGTGGNGRR